MKKLVAIMLALLMSACPMHPLPAASYDIKVEKDGGQVWTIPADSVAACKEQGGCYMVSKEFLQEVALRAYNLCTERTGVKDGK